MTVPGWQGNLQAALAQSAPLTAWERLGVEFALAFAIVFSYLVSNENQLIKSSKPGSSSKASAAGFAYAACSFVSVSDRNIFVLLMHILHSLLYGSYFRTIIVGILYLN